METFLSRNMQRFQRRVKNAAWAAFSIPVYLKVLGIGLVIAGLLSALTLHQVRHSVSNALRAELDKRANSLLTLASHEAQAHLAAPSSIDLTERLDRLTGSVVDQAMIWVEDETGELLAVAGGSGRDFASSDTLGDDAFVVSRALEDGPTPAAVTVGLSADAIHDELSAVMRGVVGWLALCIAFGFVVALGMTHLLVRPIRQLVSAAASLREGYYDTRAKVYSGDEIGALAQAFNELAGALKRRQREIEEKEAARVSLIRHIVHSQESERKMLARNLHDEIGQSLSHLLIEVQGLCRKCANTPQLCEELRGLIDETRQLAWDFRPSILDDYGLDSALKRYLQEHCGPLDIGVQCECVDLGANGDNGARLPNEVEVTLYRIAQEALTNVIRHAGARNVSVVLLKGAKEVTLIIEDDGRGFDTAALNNGGARRSLGIMGMQERAQLLGGDVTIDSRPGHGTTVRVSVSFGHVRT